MTALEAGSMEEAISHPLNVTNFDL